MIIPCPECGKKISEDAASCPKCGYRLTAERVAAIKERVVQEQRELEKWWRGLKILFGTPLLIIAIMALIRVCSTPEITVGTPAEDVLVERGQPLSTKVVGWNKDGYVIDWHYPDATYRMATRDHIFQVVRILPSNSHRDDAKSINNNDRKEVKSDGG